jgi:RHS repeat-associated protein
VVDKQEGSVTDTQCFTYDYAERLSQAWTATDNCAATPTTGNSASVGGTVAPYWQSWTYDAAGDRKTATDHNPAGVTANDTTTTYNYPAASSTTDQPNTLLNTTATGPAAATHTSSYAYDKTGATKSITGGAHGSQALTWTATGRVATDTTSAGTTSFVYDADGNQVIQRDPTTTTLFLGDQQIVLNNTTKALTGTRYYTINGQTIAVRAGTTVTYLGIDRQGTSTLSINPATGAVTRRQYLPFGETRGAAPAQWPGNKGYVGGTDDANTGLETLGVRQYDTSTGRFLSADAVLERHDPNQRGGYDYAGNNPVVHCDPTGLMYPPEPGGDGGGSNTGCQTDNACNPEPGGTDPGTSGSGGGGSKGGSKAGKKWYVVLDPGPALPLPPGSDDPGTDIDPGEARHAKFLIELQAWLRAKKGRLRGATLIVADVNVATLVDGSVRNIPRTIAFVNYGKQIDPSMIQFFANQGVPLLQATEGSGSKGQGHAEAAAPGLRKDPDGQQKILGGHMEDVNSAVSSVAICSVECSDDLNTFLNVKDKVHPDSYGTEKGDSEITPSEYAKIRGGYGRPITQGDRVDSFDYLLRRMIQVEQVPDGPDESRGIGAAGAIEAGEGDD